MRKIFLIIFLFFSINSFSQYTSDSVINKFIVDWIGKPYVYGGKTKRGIDCSAFTQRFYREIYGIKISRTCKTQYGATERVELKDLMIGDILFFASKLSPSGWHCGIYIGNNEFVHASNIRDGVKISCLFDEMYERIFKSGGRVKKNLVVQNNFLTLLWIWNL
jgi:cell wall-associated NlpC family hydrolase